MKIKDAVVLVTGANRGLGLSLAVASLEMGARRVYAGARDKAKLAALVARDPERVIPLSVDITDTKSLAAAADAAADVTLLVNNAGLLASYGVLTSSDDAIAADFSTNLFGTLAATKAFLPALERAASRGPAAIVNVLSVVSMANMPALGAYSASKAAAFSMTQALRSDLGKKGIAVHAALPGAIDTDMVRSFDMPKTSPDAVARGILDGVVDGHEDIFPDPMAADLAATYKRDHKELERRLAAMSG